MREERGCCVGTALVSFILGGLVGAGLAILMSPISGPEARRRLGDLKDDLAEKAEDYSEQARDKLDSAVSRGKDFIEEKKSILSSAIEAGKEAYKKEMQEEPDA